MQSNDTHVRKQELNKNIWTIESIKKVYSSKVYMYILIKILFAST